MSVLHRKLLRDLLRLWPQALAIALVMASGAATLIIGTGAHGSLEETRSAYYERHRFADVFVDVARAPKSIVDEIGQIPGVAAVEGRIAKIALLDIEGMDAPAAGMFISVPDLRSPLLNLPYMRRGRMPAPFDTHEVLVNEPFALAHGLGIGSTFAANLNGSRRTLRIVGLALSPEFIYALGPGDLMPDDRRFGIMWMSERTLDAAFDLSGAHSSIQLKLLRASSEAAVVARLDALLARYGGRGAYGRRDQTSHAFLDAELQQLEALSRILPPIFLVVAVFLVNMTLSRLIALEREQIGLLKALGYSDTAVGLHYLQFVGIIAVAGILLGATAGTWLGSGLTSLYGEFYRFPFLVFRIDSSIYLIAGGATLAAAGLGALRAVRDAIRLAPAVAMAPPAPPRYRRGLLGTLAIMAAMPHGLVMVLRHLTRWPVRTLSSVLGIALGVSVLTGTIWSFASIDYMIDFTYFQVSRQDAVITFTREQPASAQWSVARLPGVLAAEPFRTVPARLRHGHVERRIAVIGRPAGARLSRMLDLDGADIRLPENGVALSDMLANILGVRTGDLVEIELLERDRRRVEVPVTAVVRSYLGLQVYMDLDALNRLMREDDRISGVEVLLDPVHRSELFRTLKTTPVASFVTLKRASLERFRETLGVNLLIQVSVLVALGAIIAFGVVYNFARISLSEQGREMASLRVLGFTRAEVSAILIGEMAILVLLAQPLGWAIGYGIAHAMAMGIEGELFRVPLIVEPNVYAVASLVVIAAAAISAMVVRRRIDRLDMVEVLKTRE